MAKSSSQRKTVFSDPGSNGENDSTSDESSDGSKKSSPAKCIDTCPNVQLQRESPINERTIPVKFADLFKNQNPGLNEGSCHYVKPNVDSILVVEEEDIDKIEDFWGQCLLGCFAGRFPGLKAVRSLVDKWMTDCEILPHQSRWVIFKFQNRNELEKVLAGGPYFIYGRTLLLHSIPENFCFQEEEYIALFHPGFSSTISPYNAGRRVQLVELHPS